MFFIWFCILDVNNFAFVSSSICFKNLSLGFCNHFSSNEPVLFFKQSFCIDTSTMSSPLKSRPFLKTDNTGTSCFPF